MGTPAPLPNVGKPVLPVLLVEGGIELQGPRLHSLEGEGLQMGFPSECSPTPLAVGWEASGVSLRPKPTFSQPHRSQPLSFCSHRDFSGSSGPLPRAPAPTRRRLTLAAWSPISRQRTNHWLFSRYSTTSPDRLQGTCGEPGAGAPGPDDMAVTTTGAELAFGCGGTGSFPRPPKATSTGIPADRQHHGVALKTPEQAPLLQCRHNLLPGHKPVKALETEGQPLR